MAASGTTTSESETADAAVLAEYSQLQMTNMMLERLSQRTKRFVARKHRNKGFQPKSLFGRWLTLMQLPSEHRQMDARYRLFPRQPLEDVESRSELERLLRENYVDMTPDQAADLAAEQLHMMEQFLRDDGEPSGVEVTLQEDSSIVVGDFRTPSCWRVRQLVSEFGLTSTALMVMRYHPLNAFVGGEAALSAAAFDVLCGAGAATREGFASPLNSRLLGRPGAGFCSQFEDTDAAFGSRGSFFDVGPADQLAAECGWILNPPFVDPLLVATARKVLQLLEEAGPARYWFYITFPSWEDSEAWRILDQSEWKVARMDFPRDTFHFSDCYGTKTFKMHTKICLFVLGDLPDTVDLAVLRKQLASGAAGISAAGRSKV